MRRWVWRIVVFLLIGAVINVTVAWGLARFASVSGPVGPTSQEPTQWAPTDWGHVHNWDIAEGSGRRCVVSIWDFCTIPPSDDLVPLIDHLKSLFDEYSKLRSVDVSSSPDADKQLQAVTNQIVGAQLGQFRVLAREDSSGFPMLCLRSRRIHQSRTPVHRSVADAAESLGWWERGLDAGAQSQLSPFNPGPLPLIPLWPGFGINSAAYGAVAGILAAGLRFARTSRRTRKHLCARCSYPIGTSPVCTECGGPVKPKAVAA